MKLLKKQAMALVLGLVCCLACLEAGLRALGAGVLWSQEHANRSAPDKAGAYRIMCIGESTTADTPNGVKSYPRQLLEMLTARGGGRKFIVINQGRFGANTSEILSGLEADLDRYRPDMVIAMMGINDTADMKAFEAARGKEPFRLGDIFRTFKLAGLLSQGLEHKKVVAYFLQAGEYISMWQGRYIQVIRDPMAARFIASGQYDLAAERYDKMLARNPGSITTYLQRLLLLGAVCREHGKYREAEDIYRKAIKKEIPQELGAWNARYATTQPQRPFDQHEKEFTRAYSYFMHAQLIYELGQCYIEQGKYREAEDVYRRLVALKPDFAYMGLSQGFAAQGRQRLAREYAQKARQSGAHYYDPMTATRKNYRKLMETLDGRGIKLVAVQYPLRSIESLQMLIGGRKGVISVDNEALFRKALRRGGYDKYFVDRCYIDYGHATTEGNRLLAENIARVLLAEVFNKYRPGQPLPWRPRGEGRRG